MKKLRDLSDRELALEALRSTAGMAVHVDDPKQPVDPYCFGSNARDEHYRRLKERGATK